MSYLKEDIEGLNLSLEENKHKLSSAHLDYVQEVLPFQDKDIFCAVIPGGNSGCQSGRASADDDNIIVFHAWNPLLLSGICRRIL